MTDEFKKFWKKEFVLYVTFQIGTRLERLTKTSKYLRIGSVQAGIRRRKIPNKSLDLYHYTDMLDLYFFTSLGLINVTKL